MYNRAIFATLKGVRRHVHVFRKDALIGLFEVFIGLHGIIEALFKSREYTRLYICTNK